MIKHIDWGQAAKLVMVLLILAVILSMVGPFLGFLNSYNQREEQVTTDAIDKALVQCFALEGSYPSDLQYLVDNYGLILNTDKYVYALQNDWGDEYMANFKPQVAITLREEAVEP